MNTNRFKPNLIASLLVLAGTLALSGCGGSSDSDNTVAESANITVAFKASNTSESEYILSKESVMEGTIDATDAGNEQIGWNYFYSAGNTLFVTGYENFESKSYIEEDGELKELATFFYDAPIEVFGNLDDHTLLAMDTPRDAAHTARKLYIVDVVTGLIEQKLNVTIFDQDTGTAGEGTVAYPMALKVRGDKLFVPFHNLDDIGYYTTPAPDNALVAVYDYPLVANEETGTITPTKILSDDRTSHIGINGTSSGLIEADNGNLYSYSNGTRSAGFSPASTSPSGILRINEGETEFDESYFFNITEATDGGSVIWFEYAGNNKALARIQTDEAGCLAAEAAETGSCLWSAFTGEYMNQKLVVIDLEAQTITDVAGVPLHSKRYTSVLNMIDGKAYVSIETTDSKYVYEIDVDAATGTQGAEITGKTVKGFFDLSAE